MKNFLNRSFLAGLVAVALLLAAAPLGHAQAEKVKQKAKDLKKQVEGTAPKTNAPPAKPTPPR